MKKFIAAMLFTVSANSFAAGPYDGIWLIDPYGYVTISEKDGVMIAVINFNDTYSGYWMAFSGARVDNKVELQLLNVPDNYTGVDMTLNATITSDTTFTARQISCTPLSEWDKCILENDTVINGTKVW